MRKLTVVTIVVLMLLSSLVKAEGPVILQERQDKVTFHYHNKSFEVRTYNDAYLLDDILKGFGLKIKDNKLELGYTWTFKDNVWYEEGKKAGESKNGYIDIDLINRMFLMSSRLDDTNVYLKDIKVIFELIGEEPFNNSYLDNMVIEDSVFQAEVKALYDIKSSLNDHKLTHAVDSLKFGKLPLDLKIQFFKNEGLNLEKLDN